MSDPQREWQQQLVGATRYGARVVVHPPFCYLREGYFRWVQCVVGALADSRLNAAPGERRTLPIPVMLSAGDIAQAEDIPTALRAKLPPISHIADPPLLPVVSELSHHDAASDSGRKAVVRIVQEWTGPVVAVAETAEWVWASSGLPAWTPVWLADPGQCSLGAQWPYNPIEVEMLAALDDEGNRRPAGWLFGDANSLYCHRAVRKPGGEPCPLSEAITGTDGKTTILYGPAGSGKSVELMKLYKDPPAGTTPLFIPLRDKGSDLVAWVAEQTCRGADEAHFLRTLRHSQRTSFCWTGWMRRAAAGPTATRGSTPS
jgi:hypothetical protein